MRIHLAALAVAALFVLAGPRPGNVRALADGIPLGDLVRPKAAVTATPPATAQPEVPTERQSDDLAADARHGAVDAVDRDAGRDARRHRLGARRHRLDAGNDRHHHGHDAVDVAARRRRRWAA